MDTEGKKYFSGIARGDKFYVGEKELVVNRVTENYFFDSETDSLFSYDGKLFWLPCFGQIAFWQPVHIDPPPRPKRRVKKWTPESWRCILLNGEVGDILWREKENALRFNPDSIDVLYYPPQEYEVEE